MFDLLFVTEKTGDILYVNWREKSSQADDWPDLVGENLYTTLGIEPGTLSGRFTWNARDMLYERVALPGNLQCCLAREVSYRDSIYEQALDKINSGIQIYDKNGCMVFCNLTSRRISSIPEEVDVIGRHLLDLYDVPEDVSTVMTVLRTCAPVHNRLDTFLSLEKKEITTANTAYPIYIGNNLEGAVLFEQDVETVNHQIDELKSTQKSIEKYSANNSRYKYTGYSFNDIIGDSEAIKAAVLLAKKFAPKESNILIIGETGTGKEIFAQSIHKASKRADGKFLPINCAALPETLIESLLFGTEKGAYTDSKESIGYFEEANNGTLFLDELNSMSVNMQSKILRVLQEGEFRRIGGNKDIKCNVRILASCNEDVFSLIENKRLRKDLFYRIASVQIMIPPLRDRPEDLEALISYYLSSKKMQYRYNKKIAMIHPEVLEKFRQYSWPGNVRELFHVLSYSFDVVESDVIGLDCLPKYFTSQFTQPKHELFSPQDFPQKTLEDIMSEYECEALKVVLEHYGYNITKSAKSLGISRQSLAYRIRKYGIVF